MAYTFVRNHRPLSQVATVFASLCKSTIHWKAMGPIGSLARHLFALRGRVWSTAHQQLIQNPPTSGDSLLINFKLKILLSSVEGLSCTILLMLASLVLTLQPRGKFHFVPSMYTSYKCVYMCKPKRSHHFGLHTWAHILTHTHLSLNKTLTSGL